MNVRKWVFFSLSLVGRMWKRRRLVARERGEGEGRQAGRGFGRGRESTNTQAGKAEVREQKVRRSQARRWDEVR